MRTLFRPAAFLVLLTAVAAAQTTHTWDQSKFDEFEKGTAKGVSIASSGALELAPAFRLIGVTPSTYLWALASDAQGNVYAAGGAPARVYRITPKGEVSVLLAPSELQVQALAVGRDGTVFAATSPDGKVYRITPKPANSASKPATAPSPANATATVEAQANAREQLNPNYTSSLYFDPKTKYIWALALDNQGRLYVATGDHGELFRVEKNGQGSVFFKSDEANLRALALDPQGNVIAGSEGSGLIYRISPDGQGFVLYGAPKREITALCLDGMGNIYLAAAGEKRPQTARPVMPPASAIPAAPAAAGHAGAAAPPATSAHPGQPMPMIQPGLGATGSEIYRIAPDGSPQRMWSSREDLVYALTFTRNGRLLAGTGNKGRVYAINPDSGFSDLLKASASQVTGFAAAPNGGVYTATSNLGKLFVMEESTPRDGIYESDVFDARIFSRWGRMEVRSQGPVDLFARSGNVDNPDRNWSPWSKVDLGSGQTQIPAARFAQWRAVLHSGSPAPVVNSVRVNYLPKNVAPEVDDVAVQVGTHVPATRPPEGNPFAMPPSIPAGAGHEHGDIVHVHWSAHDDNNDQLTFSIYYRGDGDSRWLLLKEGIAERAYSFDPSLLPDGGYTIRVVASDAPSHSPNDALTGWKDSAHFEVDTTPPRIANLTASLAGDGLHITFTASDSFSDIQRAEYSIDAGQWQFIAPTGEISDAKVESYDFSVPLAAVPDPPPSPQFAKRKPGETGNAAAEQEHIVVVRVYDRADNVATAKAVVRPKP